MKIKLVLFALCTVAFSGAAVYGADEGSAPQKIMLAEGWQIQSSDKVNESGSALSVPDANTKKWYNASVPSTVMGALTRDNGMYGDLLEATNYKAADHTPFDVSWWYRTSFNLSGVEGKHISLNFDGISYRANVWLNGRLVAPKEEVFGVFCRWSFDITEIAQEHNTLAVEVFRAQKGEPNIGFVDWNPRPLDESMGLFREVWLGVTGDVELKNTRVQTMLDTRTLDEAYLNISTDLANLSGGQLEGNLVGKIENIEFSMPVTLAPNEKREVRVTWEDVEGLHVRNPRVWWSAGLGKPEMYDLDLKFVVGGEVSSGEKVAFGIRDIKTYFTDRGYKGFMLNGKKVLIKGAGWSDDIFLRDTPESNERQVRYVKDMNLNTIRFENIWGTSQNIYDLCDRHGILALVGWSCQWEWEGYLGTPEDDFMSIRTPEDMNLLVRYLNDQVRWLRNHPSIIAWFGGSDKLLRPELERRYMALLPTIDDRPYVGSAKSMMSSVTGLSGMKMAGPYDYVGPNYWFTDTENGGAYGFNTETGPGAQIPVRESLEKFVPAGELWPVGASMNYHCTTSATDMNSLGVMTGVIEGKYGAATDLDDYLMKADLVSYESTKSMFEAFRVNKYDATGVIQWMLNSAWPSLYWQLYDYYGIPTSSYYATKRANTPRQLVLNYKDNGIYLVNELREDAANLKAVVKIFSFGSELLSAGELTVGSPANSSEKIFELPARSAGNFVSLELYDVAGEKIADNFYALTARDDVYDWENNEWYMTPIKEYADFKALADMEEAKLDVTKTIDGNRIRLEIRNDSPVVAFFTTLKLKDAAGEMVCPAFWSDNYISLPPGETRRVECVVEQAGLDLDKLSVDVSGWNLK